MGSRREHGSKSWGVGEGVEEVIGKASESEDRFYWTHYEIVLKSVPLVVLEQSIFQRSHRIETIPKPVSLYSQDTAW